MASRKISLTDVSQSNRRKNAHLGGCSGEFLPAVLQSRHPRQNRYFVFRGGCTRPPPRINIKIRASLRHAAETRYPRESHSFSSRARLADAERDQSDDGTSAETSTYDNFITVITR